MGPAERDSNLHEICWLGEEDSNPRYVVQSHASNLTIPTNERPFRAGERSVPENIRNGNSGNATPRESANRGLERAARAEARHLGRWNLNLLAGARVAAVARGATRDDEGSEAGERDAAAAAERLDDAADEGIHGALGGGLRASRTFRHDCYDLGLRHREPRF